MPSETPRTADEALERAVAYASGKRSDGWNQMITATEGGVDRSVGMAAVAAEDAAKAFAWSAISIALRAQEAPVDAERERMLDLLERYGAAICAVSDALAENGLSDKGRIMRARCVLAGLAPDEHGRLSGEEGA